MRHTTKPPAVTLEAFGMGANSMLLAQRSTTTFSRKVIHKSSHVAIGIDRDMEESMHDEIRCRSVADFAEGQLIGLLFSDLAVKHEIVLLVSYVCVALVANRSDMNVVMKPKMEATTIIECNPGRKVI